MTLQQQQRELGALDQDIGTGAAVVTDLEERQS